MAVFLSMADIPDSVCIQLLKAGILGPDEIFRIVPLKRWWRFFYDVPSSGFVVTDKKIVTYGSGFSGLVKDREFLLQDLAQHSFETLEQGRIFRFRLQDGSDYSIPLMLSEEDCRMIDNELNRLLARMSANK
jgi:hypothetical protein